MRFLALLAVLAACPAAHAFTIDFEDFEPGPLPATYPTPWGDIEFHSGRVKENPIGPGTLMASGVFDADETLHFLLPDRPFEARLTLVNLNPEDRYLYAFEYAGGSEAQDYGFFIPAEGTRILEFSFEERGGFEFYGVTIDFEDRCWDTGPTTCNDLWGLDSIELLVPEPGTAALLALGLGALGLRSSRKLGRRSSP